MKRMILFITEKQDEKLCKLAKETGLAKSEITRRALDAYFLKEGRNKGKNVKEESEEKE